MKKIMIATPSYSGDISAFYVDSLVNTVNKVKNSEIKISHQFLVYQPVIQYARNTLVKQFLESDNDEIVFIDSDQAWEPDDLIKLINSNKDFVGAAVHLKTHDERYNVKFLDNEVDHEGYLLVDSIGTGFLKISRNALEKICKDSEKYFYNETEYSSVFELSIKDGHAITEDFTFCEKWKSLGGKIYIDTNLKSFHIGKDMWASDIERYLKDMGC
jgi:hypothetical protein